jgi:hypothetical protein
VCVGFGAQGFTKKKLTKEKENKQHVVACGK